MSEWYCSIDDKKYGPTSAQDLRDWLADGRLKPTDHVWTESMADWAPCNTVEEFNCETGAQVPPRQGNRKAVLGLVLGIVSLINIISVLPPLMAVGIWFMDWSVIYLAGGLWIGGMACAISGLCQSVAGKNRALETNSGRGMAVTGIVLSCFALTLMTIQAIVVVMLWT